VGEAKRRAAVGMKITDAPSGVSKLSMDIAELLVGKDTGEVLNALANVLAMACVNMEEVGMSVDSTLERLNVLVKDCIEQNQPLRRGFGAHEG
jgi:hypothetical protein